MISLHLVGHVVVDETDVHDVSVVPVDVAPEVVRAFDHGRSGRFDRRGQPGRVDADRKVAAANLPRAECRGVGGCVSVSRTAYS